MLRTFTDSQGLEWQAFDVVPRDEERRRYDRRASLELPLDEDAERREEERRLTVGSTPTYLHRGDGWLCFEQGGQRRRLAPIPEGWLQVSDAELEAYCRAAKPVKAIIFAK